MRKPICLLLPLLCATFLVAAGCLPEEEEEVFDEAAFKAVNEYVREMSMVLRDTIPDLRGWVREYYVEDLPLTYDEERREWLREHKENIEAVRNKFRENDFPTEEEIAEWEVVVARGEQEWMLEGKEVNAALDKLDELRLEVTGTIEMIERAEGELDMEQSEKVLELIEEIEPVVEEVRAVFFR